MMRMNNNNNNNNNNKIFGLVLVGGKSERMGTDKGQLKHPHQDQHQLGYSYDLLSNFCDKVFVSCREDQKELPYLKDYPQIHDQHEFTLEGKIRGPIVGILSSLNKIKIEVKDDFSLLVLACDMPYVDEKVLQYLIQSHQQQQQQQQESKNFLVSCFINPDTDKAWPEPLCAIYDYSAKKYLQEILFEREIKCPRKMLSILLEEKKLVNMIKLPASSEKALLNINTKEDYEKHRELRDMNITVKVKYYAILGEKTGISEENIFFKGKNLHHLYNFLDQKYQFSNVISKDKLRVAVNSRYVDFDYILEGAETVMFIPPIAGG
ncbi:MAG: NTP transferase domain-containing protein [Oligoflexia bacterium]|nr:NTP transferase domain-containing protein [Oligoflexia bacterium]